MVKLVMILIERRYVIHYDDDDDYKFELQVKIMCETVFRISMLL